MKPSLLAIAGLDPTGGAGLLADAKTFHHFGFHAQACATAFTAQNSQSFARLQPANADLFREQFLAIHNQGEIAGYKIGMMAQGELVQLLAELFQSNPPRLVVLDPVLVSSTGRPLLDPSGQTALKQLLLPWADLVTPNLAEAYALTGIRVADAATAQAAGQALLGLGAKAALIKGGHLVGDPVDWLVSPSLFQTFSGTRIPHDPRGTGCHLSSAILALMAQGQPLPAAVSQAKAWLAGLIQKSYAAQSPLL